MTKLKYLAGLCTLLLSLQANGSEINIQDAWIRALTPGQEDAMGGMVISSTRHARIISVISPAYTSVAILGPSDSGENKTEELEFIDLPANKSIVLGTDSLHLLLSGNKKAHSANGKVPLFVTVQFDNNSIKAITIMAQPVLSKSDAAMQLSSNVEAQASTPPPQEIAIPVTVSKPVVVHEPPVVKLKALKAVRVAAPKPAAVAVAKPTPAPVAAPKPAPVPVVAVTKPAPVAVHVVTAPLSAPLAPAVAVVAPQIVEPKKAPEAKVTQQPKQAEARASADCLSLAAELRNCDPSNDRLLEWCVNSAKSQHSCQLSMEQLKKLGN